MMSINICKWHCKLHHGKPSGSNTIAQSLKQSTDIVQQTDLYKLRLNNRKNMPESTGEVLRKEKFTILYDATISSKAQVAKHLWKELEDSNDVKLVR